MKQYVGQYGVRTITLKNNDLYYQREGRSEFKMIALEENLFMLEGLDYFRIKFENDIDKIKIVQLFSSGQVREFAKQKN